MKIKRLMTRRSVCNLGGLATATVVRNWMRTLDYKTAYYDPIIDPAKSDLSNHRFIYIFWHEYIPYQLYLRGNCNVCMLLSQNRDADWLARAALHMGFGTIRGSTFSGGRRAVRQLLRAGRQMHLTITPDGPRGPRRKLANGPIYLSSKLQIPLVALGLGYDRPWRLPTWDRFALPRPFSRARWIPSPPIPIPPNLDSHGMEHYRRRVEKILNHLTTAAENWAESGARYPNQCPTWRQPRARSYSRAA